MKIGKDIIKFDAPNMMEAMRVVKVLQNINFDPRYFTSSLDKGGLKVTFSGKISDSDITFTSADTYVTMDPVGEDPATDTWDWQEQDDDGNTIGLYIYVVVRTQLLSGTPNRLIEFKRKLTFNNFGMLENVGAEGLTIVITPIELLPST